MEKRTTIENLIVEYYNKQTKICICALPTLDKRVKVVGDFPKITGIAIKATGCFNKDNSVFICDSWSFNKIISEDVFTAYAQTFPGIGKVLSLKILGYFGVDYSVFSDFDKMYLITKRHAKEIVELAKQQEEQKIDTEYIKLLSSFGVIKKYKIEKIVQVTTMKQFLKNPFILQTVEDVKLPYKVCNSIVLQMQDDNPELLSLTDRIAGGIEYSLRSLLSNGNTYVLAEHLLKRSATFLNEGVNDPSKYITDEVIKKEMNQLNKNHKIKAEKSSKELRIYNAFYYDCENFIADELHRKLSGKNKKFSIQKIELEINKFDSNSKFKLADSQRLAVETVVNNPVAIITGSAGTGKTTVLKAAIFVLEDLGYKKIVLAAPTGRAARRMSEQTGHEASTLHSLLHLGIEDENTDETEVYMDEEKIDADVVLVDETSMCDISIIYRLLQKVNENCKIFFIGDPNQLESVGSGNVLSDMIESYCVPVVKLKFIYRQSKDSNIIMNAQRILQGKQNLTEGSDFVFIEKTNIEDIANTVADVYKQEYEKMNDLLEVQCICPMRVKGELASNQLNKIVQQRLNPCNSYSFFKANGFVFYKNDKVICGKNTKTVRNGDIGIVTNASQNQLKCVFDTGEEVFTPDDAIELNITLAYCITVHKAQGSEFKTVIMPIAEENQNMLRRNLFYTAVTRAKNKMILVGDKQSTSRAIYNNKVFKRQGLLLQRIQQRFQIQN